MKYDIKYDVCVFGGSSLDQTYFQKEDGSYNDKPDALYFGGKGANQAVAASRAGAKTVFISRIGRNEIGDKMLDNLRYNNVDIKGVDIVDDLENDYSNIYINIKDKDNDIKRFGNAIDSFDIELVKANEDLILNSTIIVCQLKCPLEVTEYLLDFCHKHNKKVVLTPCRPQKLVGREDLIDKITYITCNKEECKTIFGTDDIESCAKKYPNKLIITLGSEGLIFHNGKRFVRMPAMNVEVLDTTGAGDTLNGNFAYLLSEGMDLRHALRRAMYASSIKIQTKSAQAGMPYADELDEFIARYRNKDFAYVEELTFALNLVKNAYFRIKSHRDLFIKEKEDNTLVTNVDIETEEYLIKEISYLYKNDHFLSEEGNSKNELVDRTWIIDPIDGTSQFINGNDDWGIQIAFHDKGSTKFAVIYIPKKDELYYACEGQGTYLNNNKILNEPNTKPLNQCLIEFNGTLEKELDSKIKVYKKLHDGDKKLVSDYRYVNSSCIAFTNLAKGFISGLVLSNKKPWDIIPGLLICKEAGIMSYPMDFENRLTFLTSNVDLKDLVLTPKKENN